MIFRTDLEEALYVSWAVEREKLPEPPAPLTLDCPLVEGCAVGFVTVVLFRHRDLRLHSLGWPRLRFAQCNLRIPVRDPDRMPAIWLMRQMVPAWAVAVGRLVSRQPLVAASLRCEQREGDDAVHWKVEAGSALRLSARPGIAADAGRWRELAAFLSERPRAYVERASGLARLEARLDHTEPLPMRVEVDDAGWLGSMLTDIDDDLWKRPASTFLCSAVRLEVETVPQTAAVEPSRVPAAGTRVPV